MKAQPLIKKNSAGLDSLADLLSAVEHRFKLIEQKPNFSFENYSSLLESLYEENFITQFINASFSPSGATTNSRRAEDEAGFPILNSKHYSLSIKISSMHSTNNLATNFCDVILVNLSSHIAEIPVYQLSGLNQKMIFKRPNNLNKPQSIKCKPGKALYVNCQKHLVDLSSINKESVFMVLTSPAKNQYAWIFSKDSGKAISLTCNAAGLQTKIAISLLAELKYDEALDTLLDIAKNHNEYYIRWESAKAVYQLNKKEGESLLEFMHKNDNNEQIRLTAKNTLNKFKHKDE